VLSPRGGPDRLPDETEALALALGQAACPGWSLEGPYEGAAASLARLRDLRGHGLIALAGHAGTFFGALDPAARAAPGWSDAGGQAVVWSGEAVDCGALLTAPTPCAVDADCPGDLRCLVTGPEGGACFDARQVDLALGRVALGPDGWGALPAFFQAHSGALPDSVVWLGACRTLETGGLAATLYAAGARAVFGWDGAVRNEVATAHGSALLASLLAGTTAGAALPAPGEDPTAGGRLQLFGAADATLSSEGLLDPGFESGDLSGWTASGDVRVLPGLGDTAPVAGRRLAVVSTGLGLDPRNGTLRQTFCVPPGAVELTFWWKFLSEELPLHCGLVSQDRFTATLRAPAAPGGTLEVTAVDVAIDDLCPAAACTGCGSDWTPLTASDVSLDRLDGEPPQQTGWRRARVDVVAFRDAGPVELVLSVRDQGDSQYDTAVLLDGFEVR